MAGVVADIRVDRAGLDRLTRDPNGPMGQFVTRLCNSIVNTAKQYANVDTGLMRSRIEFRLEQVAGGALRGVVAARTNYAYWVHNGNGRYAGNPFLTDAARDVMASL